MLSSFAVPHAHYRVFQKDPAAPNDHFPLALSPHHAQSTPTDLHLRELAQLEVQVKALQLQAPVPGAVAGSLIECLLFYSRLFTVESFVWPDFLAAVCTKLAEHFASSDNVIVQSTILRIFQRAQGHVAQVNDPSKLLSHLTGPYLHAMGVPTRTLTLQMLATMPSLVVHDTVVYQQLLKGIVAADQDESAAAVEAARRLLHLLPSFRNDVLTVCRKDKTTVLCCLMAEAVANVRDAQQVWTHCAELYERLADDKSAIATLRAMTTLTAEYPEVLLERHGQVLYHVLDHDPRAFVRNFAVLISQQLVAKDGVEKEIEVLASVLETVFARMNQDSSGRVKMRIRLSGLYLLEKWSRKHEVGDEAQAFLKVANKVLARATDERFGSVYTCILANIVRRCLVLEPTLSPANGIDELLLLLHPRASIAAKNVWQVALAAIARLCQDFPESVASYVIQRLIELLALPVESDTDGGIKLRRTSIFKVLGAQLQPPHIDMILKTLPVLLKEVSSVDPTDAARMQAVAATFFLWTQDLRLTKTEDESATSNIIVEFERQLLRSICYESHAERYEMAKLAMLRGRFALALQLITEIAAKSDTECFGGWLHALQALCEAESCIASEQAVHLESLHALSRAIMYLQAARTSSFRFDFQLHLLTLRLEWVQLLLSTQQLAGEAAYTNQSGHAAGREGQLCTQLRALAHKFNALRIMLLGAPQRDLDALQVHVNMCLVLAAGVEGFLLLQSRVSIDFPPKWGVCAYKLQWNVRTVEMLSESVRAKTERVVKLSRSRQPNVGARILQQLVNALCAVPIALPPLFFRSRLRHENRLLSSAQFLTYAENTTFTSKPRSRSQLGVSLGTDFISELKGVLALSQSVRSYWQKRVAALEAEVLVCVAGEDTNGNSFMNELRNGSTEEKRVHHRMLVTPPIAWDQVVETAAEIADEKTTLYVPFATPVHIKAAELAVKGSYVLVAKLKIVDCQGEKWPLAATGCRRGFIVY